MKNKTKLKIVIILLIVFFELQFLSHLFLKIAPEEPGVEHLRLFKISSLFFPIDPEPLSNYAFLLLKKNCSSQNTKKIEKSINYLKKSIKRNMLYYQAHFYLGKAYLCQNIPNSENFSHAVNELKRAAFIRSRNLEVSKNTLILMLSLWPHLNEKDRVFCKNLFTEIINKISSKDIKSILEVWGLYVRDVELLKEALRSAPQHYSAVAKQILPLGLDLKLRHNFMSNHEIYTFMRMKRRIRELKKKEGDYLKGLKSIRKTIQRRIKGFYKIANNEQFERKNFYDFKKWIDRNILKVLFEQQAWKRDLKKRQELVNFIISSITHFSSRDILEFYYDFLIKKKFFEIDDLRVFYIKQLLNFKLDRYETVIIETEDLKRSISYVKKEHAKDYVEILLLQSDAYFSSKLLTKALSTIMEIRKISPDLIDSYWGLKRIEEIFGPEEGKDKNKIKKYKIIENSRFIELNSLSKKRTVYLRDKDEIEIIMKETLKKKIKSRHLLQIFVNGQIHYEEYLNKLEDSFKVKIPTDERYAKLKIQIKII